MTKLPLSYFFFEFQIFWNFKFFRISKFSNFKFFEFRIFQTSKFQNFQIFSWQPPARTPQKNLNFKFQNLIKFDFWKNLKFEKFDFPKKFEIRKIWNLKILKFEKKIWQGQFGHFEILEFINWVKIGIMAKKKIGIEFWWHFDKYCFLSGILTNLKFLSGT